VSGGRAGGAAVAGLSQRALALWAALMAAITAALLLLIKVYQRAVSPWTGRCCRFAPSCSAYAAESLRKHGLGKGAVKAAWRVLRCHPFSRGGFDPP
jgi:hypothetical protein